MEIDSITGNGIIEAPHAASPIIGSGGNYRQRGARLLGKIQGSGRAPRTRRQRGNQFLEFTTSPARNDGNDRSELTHPDYLPLSRDVLIEWSMRIPDGAPTSTGFMYALQLWQGAPHSPIGGVRVTAGTSHQLNFNPHGGRFNLSPGQWHDISLTVSRTKQSVAVDGRSIGTRNGPMGLPHGAVSGPGADAYRVKFGIYRSDAPAGYITQFDDLQITVL